MIQLEGQLEKDMFSTNRFKIRMDRRRQQKTLLYRSTLVLYLLLHNNFHHFLFMSFTAVIIKVKKTQGKLFLKCAVVIVCCLKTAKKQPTKKPILSFELTSWTDESDESEMKPPVYSPRRTLLPLSPPQTPTDLELQARCERGHPALAKFGKHRGQHGEQHEGILGVLLHGTQVPKNLFINCQSQIQIHL